MKATVSIAGLVAVFASAVAAQSTSPSACAADYIVEACLNLQNPILAACGTSNYDCSCAAYQGIVTCFNNCPNDSRRATYEGQVTIHCGYAQQYPSRTTAGPASPGTPGSSGTGTGTGTAVTTGHPTVVATSTPTASNPASQPGNSGATGLVSNAGGMLAAIAAVAAALL